MTAFNRFVDRLSIFCLIASPFILAIYLLHYAVADFSSDAAMNSVLARVMHDAHSIFPRDWIISNGEGPFPSTAMLIAPLLSIYKNTFQLHAIFSLLMAGLLIWSYWLFLKTIPHRPKLQIISFSLMIMGFSYPFVRMVYVETAYFWWPFCFFVCAYFTNLGFLKAKNSYFYICALVLFGFAIKNPQRVAIMVAVPLIAYASFFNFSSLTAFKSHLKTRQMRIHGLLTVTSMMAAFAFTKLLTQFGFLNDQSVVSGLHLANFSQIWANTKVFLNGWFLYLGSDAEIYAYQSFEPFFRAIRSAFVVFLTIFAWLGAVKYIVSEQVSMRALSAAFFCSFFSILLLYIFTTSLAVNHLTMRYFTIPYLLALALALVYLIDQFAVHKYFTAITSLAVILTTVSGYSRLIPCPGLDCQPRQSHVMQISQMLEREGLQFGYANWWVAGGPTILSEEKLLIAPINVSEAEISPFTYMVDTKWYGASSQQREKFIMLLDGEATPAVLSMLKDKYGSWSREVRATGVVVLVFDPAVVFFN